MQDPNTDVIQGTLDMLILKTLSLQPMHGYGIARRIEQISRGTFKVNPGSLLTALQRLERSQAGAFQCNVVVVTEVVHAEHVAALRLGETAGDMVADEPGRAGHEDFHSGRDSAARVARLEKTPGKSSGTAP